MREIFLKSIFQTNLDSFGVDLSDSSIKWVRIDNEKDEKTKSAIFYDCAVPKGVIVGGEIKDKKVLSDILKSNYGFLKKKFRLSGYAISSLPEQETFIRVIQIPKIDADSVATAVRFEAEENIPLDSNEIYLDWEQAESAASIDHLDVVLAAAPKRVIDGYFEIFKMAEISVAAFEPESQALARALMPDFKSDEPVLIVDFGANGTNFTVFSGKTLKLTTTIPISGTQISEKLSVNMNISFEKAEREKFTLNLKSEPKNSEKIKVIEPVISALAERIKDYASYYKNYSVHEHSSNKTIAKVILCGGDSNLFGLCEYLQEKTGFSVKLGDPMVNVKTTKKSQNSGIPPKSKLLSYTTAIGLALRGAK